MKKWKFIGKNGYSNNLCGNYFKVDQITDYEPIVKKFPEFFQEVKEEKEIINIEYVAPAKVEPVNMQFNFVNTEEIKEEPFVNSMPIIEEKEEETIIPVVEPDFDLPTEEKVDTVENVEETPKENKSKKAGRKSKNK